MRWHSAGAHREGDYMSRAYPIWNDVSACIYKSGKSYGARDTSEATVLVGTSKTNSKFLARTVTTRRPYNNDWTVFKFGMDTGTGLSIVAEKYMHNKTKEWRDTAQAVQP
jgi:hypothetical protein